MNATDTTNVLSLLLDSEENSLFRLRYSASRNLMRIVLFYEWEHSEQYDAHNSLERVFYGVF